MFIVPSDGSKKCCRKRGRPLLAVFEARKPCFHCNQFYYCVVHITRISDTS